MLTEKRKTLTRNRLRARRWRKYVSSWQRKKPTTCSVVIRVSITFLQVVGWQWVLTSRNNSMLTYRLNLIPYLFYYIIDVFSSGIHLGRRLRRLLQLTYKRSETPYDIALNHGRTSRRSTCRASNGCVKPVRTPRTQCLRLPQGLHPWRRHPRYALKMFLCIFRRQFHVRCGHQDVVQALLRRNEDCAWRRRMMVLMNFVANFGSRRHWSITRRNSTLVASEWARAHMCFWVASAIRLTELQNDTQPLSMLYWCWIQGVIGVFASSALTILRTCVRLAVIPMKTLARTDVNYHGFG